MNDITAILDFSSRSVDDIINDLRDKTVYVPDWIELLKDYEPTAHTVCKDTTVLRDKMRSDGTVEKSARIYIGLEKLLSKRVTEFTFSVPVKRIYPNTDNDTRLQIAKAIESIYLNARINSVNLKRGLAYYAACEIFTIWYAVKRPNILYGFSCDYKLKCKTYSPMDGVKLYPLFDEYDDMIAMSVEYTKTVKDETVTVFETYTADRHYMFKRSSTGGSWETVKSVITDDGQIENGEDVVILKIPGVYAYRPTPVYHGLSNLRSEIEYTLSRNSNVIAYNSAPILKVAGGIKGEEKKGDAKRVWRTENGGDVAYVSWSQAIEALKYHVDTMLKLFFMQAQIPDISFENMKSLGNIGYDARQTLLTDAHLRIGDEEGVWIEFFDRECNVIKAFLKQMNKKWENEIDNVIVEHKITPFIQNDELSDINKRLKANGGKPIESQLESIQRYGKSDDAAETLAQIQKEEAESSSVKADMFNAENQVI